MSLLDLLFAPGALTPVFQPIVELGPPVRLYALECLTRGPRGTHFQSADVMFDYVRLKGIEPEIDRRCIALGLEASSALGLDVRLSFNVHATTLARDGGFVADFLTLLRQHEISPSLITLEIVEHSAPWLTDNLRAALARLRRLGVHIALDDVGLAHSNFKMIVDVEPDYLKLDRYFVRDLQGDPYRRAIVECVLSLGARIGARVVTEGVSDEAELAELTSMGVEYAQGFLFARPATAPELRSHPLIVAAHRRSQPRELHVR